MAYRLLIFDWDGTLFNSSSLHPSLFSGAFEVLQALKNKHYLLAVATHCSRVSLEAMLKNFGVDVLLDATRCAEETAPKPQPLMINEILAVLSVSPQDTLLIGDNPCDMQLADRAGVDKLAVAYGSGRKDALLGYHPLFCIDHVQQLLDIL